MNTAPPTESAWRLRADLTTAKVLIWAASVGRDAALTPETHFYLADRYDRLSHIYRVRGRHAKARRLALLAAEHYHAGGWKGPPFAAAMAMPRPSRWVSVDAVAREGAKITSDDVA
jgi:hypothetical protein